MYILRIPFELQDGSKINSTNEEIVANDLVYNIKDEGDFYALIIKGFLSEEHAKCYFERARVGLSWVLLHCGLAPVYSTDLQKVHYAKDPVSASKNLASSFGLPEGGPIDGLMDGRDAVVFDGRKNYKTITGGKANLIYGASLERFFAYFLEGTKLENGVDSLKNKKLRISLDMYAAFYSEASPNAKFLTLIMALESLCEPVRRPEIVVTHIQKFQESIGKHISSLDEDSEEFIAFEALMREVDFRKGSSIRVQIRKLVHDALKDSGNEDCLEVSKRAVKLYDKRSELVHNGEIKNENLSSLTGELRVIVERVLRCKITGIDKLSGANA